MLLNVLSYAAQNGDIGDDKASHRIRIDVRLTPRGTTRADKRRSDLLRVVSGGLEIVSASSAVNSRLRISGRAVQPLR